MVSKHTRIEHFNFLIRLRNNIWKFLQNLKERKRNIACDIMRLYFAPEDLTSPSQSLEVSALKNTPNATSLIINILNWMKFMSQCCCACSGVWGRIVKSAWKSTKHRIVFNIYTSEFPELTFITSYYGFLLNYFRSINVRDRQEAATVPS